jgi:WD40 repeat protein
MRHLLCLLTLLAVSAVTRAEADPPPREAPEEKPSLVLDTGGHTAPVVSILFTPDSTKVITVGEDSTIQVWAVDTGERLNVLRPPAASLRAAALSPDGRTLAVSGVPYTPGPRTTYPVFLVSLGGGRIDKVLAEQHPVDSLTFSPDGKRLAVGTFTEKERRRRGPPETAQVHLWEVGPGKKLDLELTGDKPRIPDLAFSPDGRSLAAVEPGDTTRIWPVAAGGAPQVLRGGYRSTTPGCLAWSPDGKTLVVGGSQSPTVGAVLQVWSADGKLVKEFDHGQLRPRAPQEGVLVIHSVSFLPGSNDEVLLTWSRAAEDEEGVGVHGQMRLHLTTGRHPGVLAGGRFSSPCGALSPDGKLAAITGGPAYGVTLRRLGDRDHPDFLNLVGKGKSPYRVGWSPDGHSVAWGLSPRSEKPLVAAFSLTDLVLRRRDNFTPYKLDERERDGVSLKRVAGGLDLVRGDATVRKADPNPYRCGTVFPGGDRAAVPAGNVLHLWDTRTGKSARRYEGPPTAVLAVAGSPDGRYLLAAHANQSLTVYAVNQSAPLLSLFVAGPEWVAWTPEGYYAASPGGERLMGWQVNNGPDRLATFYPASQFRARLYRPDVISRVLDAGTVAKALELADKERGQKTEAVELKQVLPPEVTITAPTKSGTEVTEPRVEVSATARAVGNYPVESLLLLLDGRPYEGERGVKRALAAQQGSLGQSWTVRLTPGPHRLRVLARSPVSTGASTDLDVTYKPAKPPPPATGPTLYVLAIGINAYPGSLRLEWAVQDAADVAQVCVQKGQPQPFGRVETRLLLDPQATRRGVLDGFDWLKKQMTGDDTAVIFYAGHGHKDKKDGEFYLVPQDVNVNDLARTAVSGAEIRQKLVSVPGKVLVLLDACHSGAIGGSRPAAALTSELRRALAADDCGVVVMCAAMAGEEAGESPDARHGYFTKALVEGLAGKAPRNREGFTHLTGLHFYVEEQVSELSKDDQHVVIDRPATVASFPLTHP